MFLHVDLDAFFASVEQLLNPQWRGLPVIVAGIGRRGVVSAASYEARAFGVRSAMPTSVARQRCPQGIFVQPRSTEYARLSEEVMEILRSFTPEVEPVSIDEAFLAVDGIRRLRGDAVSVARLIREQVKIETGLTISVGVATTKFLAKIASDLSKPDGLLVVEPGKELAFLHPLPARRLWGVGPKTMEKLERIAVETIGDIAALPLEALRHVVGRAAAEHLHALSHNLDPRSVTVERNAKSIGNEETFSHDLRERSAVDRELLRLGTKVAGRLRASDVAASVVTVKLRFEDFSTITRSRTLRQASSQTAQIVAIARELVAEIDVARGVRLLGVHCSSLTAPTSEHQGTLDLFAVSSENLQPGLGEKFTAVGAPAFDERQARIDTVVDAVRAKFGSEAVAAASLRGTRTAQHAGDAGAIEQIQEGDKL